MIHAFDSASWARALSMPLDPELTALLTARRRLLEADGLLDMTDVVVVTAVTTEADLVEAIGWAPLTDPDGRRHDEPAFVQPFDYIYRASRNYHIAVQIVGNAGHAFELIVADTANPALVALCREQAA
ncbi:hypothetical protein [Sphingomonas sp.]|uniref:hypothetical protein n=1 Tax=Sphingomonas sp. TaxID=28214 RepID=UPI000DB02089|nr:hypothetical protein [Sphingomonas sp.]PZU08516.1 MAG: hypothetical protein DI605_11100 [Sphingomonas sp.]